MVCTRRRGRMAAMAKLLANGYFPEITTEEASHEKLAAHSIHRELREAVDANLLEEEDMHVFDCRPMTDPLHLVCCKDCKRPVKASQYASHAERCRSVNSTEETVLEIDGGTGHKKPPRKARKKLQTAHDKQGTTVREQESFRSIDGDDTAVTDSNNGDLKGVTPFSREAKRNAASIAVGSVMDGSANSPGSRSYPAAVMNPSDKSSKLIAAENLLVSEGLKTAHGIVTNMGINCQKALIYPPMPLATKMYSSQRNLRLRYALNHLYHGASSEEKSSDLLSSLPQENVLQPQLVSLPKNSLHESESDALLQKKDAYTLPAVRIPDQVLAQSSDLCMGKSTGHSSAMNFSNQFRDKTFSRPALSVDTTSMGMMRNRYLPTAYSYPVNSGSSLAGMQQSNGSVPVI